MLDVLALRKYIASRFHLCMDMTYPFTDYVSFWSDRQLYKASVILGTPYVSLWKKDKLLCGRVRMELIPVKVRGW